MMVTLHQTHLAGDGLLDYKPKAKLLAKSWNIQKYSNNRFSNVPLNENALPLEELKTFPLNKINYNENFIKNDHLYYLKMIFALLREKIYLKAIKTLV